MKKVLQQSFFNRPAPQVAQDLLGKYLVRKIAGKEIASMVTEVEAYEGHDDLASHGSKGRTQRTEIMFGEAGHIYVYLIYGMYMMLNIVTGEKDHPAGVLIRSTADVTGPGRLTRALHITKDLYGKRALPASGLWFEDRGHKIAKRHITTTPRIGVDYAGEHWAGKLWRFVLVEK